MRERAFFCPDGNGCMRVDLFRVFACREKGVMRFKDAGLTRTNDAIGMLEADFSGLLNLDTIVEEALKRMMMNEATKRNVAMVKGGSKTMEEFDGWFAELVRFELGHELMLLRQDAVAKAVSAGAGSAASAIHRKTYKDELKVNLNILDSRKRISSRKRVVEEASGGVSGIRRSRTISERTRKIRENYGPDRAFILRFLNRGTDVRVAKSSGPSGRGSMATYGARGSIDGSGFFNTMRADMEEAARRLGVTLIGRVEQWLDGKFKD